MNSTPSIEESLAAINARLARMEKLWTEMFTKRPTQKQLAKRAGVHPVTISRRKAKAARIQMLNSAV